VIELLVIQVFSKLLSFSIIKEDDIILCNAFDAYKKFLADVFRDY
jgi:hypothetical protein